MVLLIPLCFVLLIFILSRHFRDDFRETILKAYTLLFLFILFSTEITSTFHHINYKGLSLAWFFFFCLLSGIYFFSIRSKEPAVSSHHQTPIFKWDKGIDFLLASAIVLILILTFFIGLLSPPNTFDSMTYHMARVAQWIDHQNINFYPTSIDRQNYMMPLSEYAILHLQVLSKTDRFAYLVQWMGFNVSILLVSLIAKELKGSFRIQLLSAVFAATIPMAILQSTSTQNDLIVSIFSLSFAYFFFKLQHYFSHTNLLFCALSLGLALVTKGTAYLYCGAIALLFGSIYILSSPSKPKALCHMMLIIIIGVSISSGHLIRTYRLYGHPIANVQTYKIKKFSLPILCRNIIRNTALHMGTPFPSVNERTRDFINHFLGDHLDEPKSMYKGQIFSIPFTLHEDAAGNVPHFGLIIIAVFALPFVTIDQKKWIYYYGSTIFIGFILFCGLLKWQVWNSRLHTPLFIFSAPFVMVVLSNVLRYHKRLLYALPVILFVYSIPFLLLNPSRPLLPYKQHCIINTEREKLYFINKPKWYRDYKNVIKKAMNEKVAEIGLSMGENDWEYPLWVLAGRSSVKGQPRFRHIGVTDISRKLAKRTSPPLIVLATGKNQHSFPNRQKYNVIYASKCITAFKHRSDQ